MKVVIIEDEVPVADRLKKLLAATDRGIEVAAVLDSLAGARAWFGVNRKYLVNSAAFKKWFGK
jgi:hypothetical protein